ncbi:hypothetical protein [Quatrionicoccus australiensis]|uniref:hypothetical protein n=1 Tax=Quatrionicoccus australiensis TaxID=138118 RepID=UPI001CF85A6B|nr:hypothetical protein [Quatrionicoccus australiensis]UCV13541.1 hypothetical protein KI612_11245 [Quatrionicoccus australiensis]
MRKFLIFVLTSLAAMGVHAWEPMSGDMQQFQEEPLQQQLPSTEAIVTITPVPTQAMVVELTSYAPKPTSIRQAKKAKAAKVAGAKSMLSRSAREQIVLANSAAKQDEPTGLIASDSDDEESSLDDLDLHRSFSKPRVARSFDQMDEDDASTELPGHIKLRLLLARIKAVDAFNLNQASKASGNADDGLSDAVKLRLQSARAQAVKLHAEKFGNS